MGKSQGTVFRAAAVLALLHDPEADCVAHVHVEAAAEVVRDFAAELSHVIGNNYRTDAHDLLDLVTEEQEITIRDTAQVLQKRSRWATDTTDRVRAAAELLVDHGWIWVEKC